MRESAPESTRNIPFTIELAISVPRGSSSDGTTVVLPFYNDPMNPITAKSEFEKFVSQSGVTIAALTPGVGIHLMLEFYEQIRADNCPIDQDGDMLLYQWGVYDWGEGAYFQIDITRQFIEAGLEGDDGMSQLSICFNFYPSDEFKQLEQGDRWCGSPAELSYFESYIKTNAAYIKVENANPTKLEVEYSKI